MAIRAFILLVIRVCFIFQPALSVDHSTLPAVLMGAAPSNQNHLVVIAMEVSEIYRIILHWNSSSSNKTIRFEKVPCVTEGQEECNRPYDWPGRSFTSDT